MKSTYEVNLAHDYCGRYLMEKDIHKKPPKFHVYAFQVSRKTIDFVRDSLAAMLADPPEYNFRSKGKARNCASLSLETLQLAGAVAKSIRFPRPLPRPKDLDVIMRSLARRRKTVDRIIATLKLPHFKKRKS